MATPGRHHLPTRLLGSAVAAIVVFLFLLNGLAPGVLASPTAAPAHRAAERETSPATSAAPAPLPVIPYSHAFNGSEFSAAYLAQCEVRACPTNQPGVTFQDTPPSVAVDCATLISLTAGPYTSTLKFKSTSGSGATLDFYYDVGASGSLKVCAGVTTQSIRFTFFGSCLFCITIPTGIAWLNFTESYSETVTVNASVSAKGHEGFKTGDLNGPPKSLASFNLVNEAICCGPIPIVYLNLDLDIAAEYQFTFDRGSWLNITQGSTGTYSQNYSFSTSQWTDFKSTQCSNGATLASFCTTLTHSPSFGGSILLRIGPELVLTLSAGVNTGIFDLELAAVSIWAFFYAQASLYFGVGPSTSVYTGCGNTAGSCKQVDQAGVGGSCGSNSANPSEPYQVWGLNPDPMYPFGVKGDPAGDNFWGVLCAGVGLQFGGSFKVFSFTLENPLSSIGIGPANIYTWTLWKGSLFPTQTFYIYNGTLATSMDLCDVTQKNCTATFTGQLAADNGTSTNPGPWEMYDTETDILVVDTALHNETPGGTKTYSLPDIKWATTTIYPVGRAGTCGNLTPRNVSLPTLPDDRGPWNVFNYTAPNLADYPGSLPYVICQVSFNSSSPISIPSLQVSNVTVWIRVVPPPGPEYPVTFLPSCLPSVCNFLEYTSADWSVSVTPSSGGSEAPQVVGQDTAPFNQNLTIPRLPNGEYSYTLTPPANVTAQPITGSFAIDYTREVVSTKFVPLQVKVTEQGLRSGTQWFATLDGTTVFGVVSGTGSAVVFNTTSGKFTYTVGNVPGCLITSGAKRTITVTTKNVADKVVFSCGSGSAAGTSLASSAAAYLVTFEESGLPASDDAWYAFVTPGVVWSGSVASFQLSLPNGTYALVAGGPAGYAWAQTASVGPETFTVHGAALEVPVIFGPFKYSVTIFEFGLPSGTAWSTTITHSSTMWSFSTTSDEITAHLRNGTRAGSYYTYAIPPIPGYQVANGSWSGGFNVSGANVSIVIEFVPFVSTVTFVEYGLVPGASFAVAFDGEDLASDVTTLNSSTPLTFTDVPNGSFEYSIDPVSGYSASQLSGLVTVSGEAETVDVNFTSSTTYQVTFHEVGLPSGTPWRAGAYDPIFGGNLTSMSDDIDFELTPGYYAYFGNTTRTGYSSAPTGLGLFEVLSSSLTVTIQFNTTNSSNGSSVRSIPPASPAGAPGGGAMPPIVAATAPCTPPAYVRPCVASDRLATRPAPPPRSRSGPSSRGAHG